MFRFLFVAFVALFFVSGNLMAQVLAPASGEVEVVQDIKIEQMSEMYRKMSLNNPAVDGYRVQIFFDSGSNSKNKATSIKSDFEVTYPGVKSYLTYKEPYYRVRVGNFRTLIEAVGFQKKIAVDYPNSFAVKDEIVL